MGAQKVLPVMTGGEGENSYAMNSGIQKAVISNVKSYVEDTVKDLYCKTLPKCLTIADLGCSSGPNSLLVVSEILEAIHSICEKLGHTSPEFQVLLNDLPTNDFNTLFKPIPNYLDKLKQEKGDEFGPCFITGVPGSFHGRLFPKETLHFVHSSYSLHILSQVPPGIENKGHIYLTKGSSPGLIEAYQGQFQKDFSGFLGYRAAEVVAGGRMVITMMGRTNLDPTSDECCVVWELIAKSLRDLVAEELVEESKVDAFNWLGYYPCPEEVGNIIKEQGSFQLDAVQTFGVDVNANNYLSDGGSNGEYVSRYIRAVSEGNLVTHFGKEIIDDLFCKLAKNVNVYLLEHKPKVISVVMCMTKKG